MKLSFVDTLAWYLVRLASLVLANIFDFVMRYYKARDMNEYIDMLSHWMGAWYIYAARNPDEVPDYARRQLINQGRMMLVLIVAILWVVYLTKVVGV